MMRTAKFRAWDEQVNHMYHPGNQHVALWCDGYCVNLQTGEKLVPLFFTGILDRHGKEIYEGDVVRWGHNINTLGEGMGVCFDGGFEEGHGEVAITPLGICFGKNKMLWDFEGYLESPIDENIGELEVIGNIYENGDLLK